MMDQGFPGIFLSCWMVLFWPRMTLRGHISDELWEIGLVSGKTIEGR
jgi:hypothetical protein